MFEYEKVLEVAVQRMSEDDKALYMGLYNSHIIQLTGLGLYSAICNLGSWLNHRYSPFY